MTENHHPFVFYRLPGADTIHFISGKSLRASLNDAPANSFCIQPYSAKENTIFILPEAEENYSTANFPVEKALYFWYGDDEQKSSSDQNGFQEKVNEALTAIGKNQIRKAVLSRSLAEALPKDFSVLTFYKKIVEVYPAAFVYLLSHPSTGTWLGATPELFLKYEDGVITTMSLAGTRNQMDAAPFADKEMREQEFVSMHIRKIIAEYAYDADATAQQNADAGNLIHLQNIYTATLKENISWREVAGSLHPTPAVAGTPTKNALDFIATQEGYQRHLYTGYLGNISGDSASLFVNLRCMQLFHSNALLYAGCGIVEGSVPEDEWYETEAKLNTLRRYLHS